MTMTTRPATRGELTSGYAASLAFHGNFLPRTIRDTGGAVMQRTKPIKQLETEGGSSTLCNEGLPNTP